MSDDSPIRDTAKMSVDFTPEGMRVEFTASGGTVIRLRLNSYVEALTLMRNLLDAMCRRWPTESAEVSQAAGPVVGGGGGER